MYKKYNPNPEAARVGDCTVRALCKALEQDWNKTYLQLCVQGLLMADMPSANAVWGAYLSRRGFKRGIVSEACPSMLHSRGFRGRTPSRGLCACFRQPCCCSGGRKLF